MPWRLVLQNEPDELFPVQAFFNAVSDASFLRVVDSLTRGIGAGMEDAVCAFPGDLDPGEPRFDGVRFSLYEDYVVISHQRLHGYLEVVCRDFIAAHLGDREVIEVMLARR